MAGFRVLLRSGHKQVWRFQDDALSTGSLEMGRRKLPSIPTLLRTEKVSSETTPAPVYLTSSAPLVSATSAPDGRQYFSAQDSRAYSRTSPRTASLTDLTLPCSSSSLTSSSRVAGAVDPTILPGAAIVNVRPKVPIRQTTSAATGNRGSVLGSASSTKMPSPLARVLLKKELKEVLERRRELLEACEIEANQRQYVVHRMLITGLLPEYRPADIDNIPNVIPCLLPIELISGAQVVPSEAASVVTSMTTTSVPDEKVSVPCHVSSIQSDTQEIGVSTDDLAAEPRQKSVGIQSETSLTSHLTSSNGLHYHHTPSTSLRRQIEHDRNIVSHHVSQHQPHYRTAETQTNGAVHYERHNRSPNSRQRRRTSSSNHFSSSEPNLLESTAKYFAEYDRQLREHGRRLRNRFAFSDDDPVSRESKKQRLMDELAKRKERISSMVDLRSTYSNFPTVHPTSDYSSTVPHYGSLPRIDFPVVRSSRMSPRDYSARSRSRHDSLCYGSLPRNYERYWDSSYGGESGYFQSAKQPRRHGSMPRSMHDLSYSTDDDLTDIRQRPLAAHSANYLDTDMMYPSDDQAVSSYMRPIFNDNMHYGETYATDRPQNARFKGSQCATNADMISHYANYLSNQFISDQQRLLCDSSAEQQTYPNLAYQKHVPYPGSLYNEPHSLQRTDFYGRQYPSEYGYSQSSEQHYPQIMQRPQVEQTEPYNYLPSQQSYLYSGQPVMNASSYRQVTPAVYGPREDITQYDYQHPSYVMPSYSQVYSRNEINYGSRPAQYATEYGNFHRRSTRPMNVMGDVTNRSFLAPRSISVGAYPTSSAQYRSQSPYHRFAYSGYPHSLSQPAFAPDCRVSQPYTYKAWSNGNIPLSSYDAVYPKEDALSRMYASLGHSRASQYPQYGNFLIPNYSV